MNDGQVKQIVSAIREHTRAMVFSNIKLGHMFPNNEKCLQETDALLAALSASSPNPQVYPHFRCPECGPCVDADEDWRCKACGKPCDRVARPDSVAVSQAATPPLSADLVTVRRADLVLYLDHSNRVKMASLAWDADLLSAMQRLREAVRR